jgi:hypothetical protein
LPSLAALALLLAKHDSRQKQDAKKEGIANSHSKLPLAGYGVTPSLEPAPSFLPVLAM